MTDGPTSIEAMYPPVPVCLLVADEWQRRFRESFLDTGDLECDPFEVAALTTRPQGKCFSVSLFRQNVDNQFPGQFPVDEDRRREKYWEGLRRVVGEMDRFPGGNSASTSRHNWATWRKPRSPAIRGSNCTA
jgi:hypothetical protein